MNCIDSPVTVFVGDRSFSCMGDLGSRPGLLASPLTNSPGLLSLICAVSTAMELREGSPRDPAGLMPSPPDVEVDSPALPPVNVDDLRR